MAEKKKWKWDASKYELVKDRIVRFWERHPKGRIDTVLHSQSEDGSRVVFRAALYREYEDEKPVTVGWASDVKTPGHMINEVCWLENCESSAVGRALANYGMHGSKDNPNAPRPTREEMESAQRRQEAEDAKTVDDPVADAKGALLVKVSQTEVCDGKIGDARSMIHAACKKVLGKDTMETLDDVKAIEKELLAQEVTPELPHTHQA